MNKLMKSALIRPVGDRTGDGSVQLSFTLPVSQKVASSLAIELCRKMNLQEIEIVSLQAIGLDNTYIQVFAKTNFGLEASKNLDQSIILQHTREELITLADTWAERKVLIGACTGTDAHTIGLDAILNKKGYKGDKGLESYPCFSIVNLGSQVQNRELIQAIEKYKADVILISQVITHQNVHLHNLTEFIDMLESVGLRDTTLCLIGGPRITHQLALELGFDAGFGIGTTPIDVANYIIQKFV